MSKYNAYAKKLDAAFKAAQEAYKAEAEKLNAAQKARNDAFTYSPSTPIGNAAILQQAQRQQAEAAFAVAKDNFKTNSRSIVVDYENQVAKLRQELKAAVEAENLVDPAEIDNGAMALLNSGIMTAADFQHMAEQFKDNTTMRRLIGSYAGKAEKERDGDRQEAAALRAIRDDLGRDGYSKIETFNSLADASIRYMGSSSPERCDYAQKMQAHWEDGDIREAVDSF